MDIESIIVFIGIAILLAYFIYWLYDKGYITQVFGGPVAKFKQRHINRIRRQYELDINEQKRKKDEAINLIRKV